jgi:hypothetical protein
MYPRRVEQGTTVSGTPPCDAIDTCYWLRVFGFSGLEELIGKVDSGERGITTAILK